MEKEVLYKFKDRLRRAIWSIECFKTSFSSEKLDEVHIRTRKVLDSLNVIESIIIENKELKKIIKLQNKGE